MWAVQTGITVLKRRLKTLLEEKDEPREGEAGRGREAGEEETDFDESINATLLEKQLLAVQMSLRDEIGEEKRQIVHLLGVLRDVSLLFLNFFKIEKAFQLF